MIVKMIGLFGLVLIASLNATCAAPESPRYFEKTAAPLRATTLKCACAAMHLRSADGQTQTHNQT
jgi:hypothetical protein